MNWLLLRDRNAPPPGKGEAPSRSDASPRPEDRYRDAPLGVECAWPPRDRDGSQRKPD